MYFQHIDRHLEGEAAKWVMYTPNVRALVYKGYMEVATGSDVDVFYGALSGRFKLNEEESRKLRGADPLSRLMALRQGASESLEQYTGRFRDTLFTQCSRDGDNDPLIPVVVPLLTAAIAQYALGLSSEKLKESLCQLYIHHPVESFSQARKMAEALTRIIESEEKAEARNSTEKKRNKNKKRKRAMDGESEGEDNDSEKHQFVPNDAVVNP